MSHTTQMTVQYDMIRIAPYAVTPSVDENAMELLINKSLDYAAPTGEIVARAYGDHYEVVCGLEHFRAYREAFPRGSVPLDVRHLTNEEAVKVAIECPPHAHILDLINCYKIALSAFKWSHSKLAALLGISRSALTNQLKLNDLDSQLKEHLRAERIGLEHAKLLCRLTPAKQKKFAEKVVRLGWDTRTLASKIKGRSVTSDGAKDRDQERLENRLGEIFGTTPTFDLDPKLFHGDLVFRYESLEVLEGIIQTIQRKTNSAKSWQSGELRIAVNGLNHLDVMLKDLT